jgi:predicted phosphate transport protein (TIGR00153 family)
MSGIFKNYFSNRSLFYNLFNEAAKNMINMANLLVKVVNTEDEEKREPIFKQIDKLENNGDDITHQIYLALDKVIFTPLNRNAIHALAAAIDDVADTIQEASGRMYLYHIIDFSADIKQIASLILEASKEIEKTVALLKIPKSRDEIIIACRQIKQYEHQSDQIYYNAVAKLFEDEKDAINLIKYREILASLEGSVNRCKNAAEALEGISLNNY